MAETGGDDMAVDDPFVSAFFILLFYFTYL